MIEPPKNVFCVRKRLKSGEFAEYWYHQAGRNGPSPGPRTALPKPNTEEWFAALAKLTKTTGGGIETVEQLWQDYKTSPRWPKSDASRRLYESTYTNHIRASFGSSAIASITGPHVVALRDSRSHMPQTANMILKVLSNMWVRAVEIGAAVANTPKAVKALTTDPDEAKPLSDKAWAALISPDAPELLRRFAYLGRGTGQRISDLITFTPAMREDGGIRHKVRKIKADTHWNPVGSEYLSVIDGWQCWPTRRYLQVDDVPTTIGRIRRIWTAYAKTEAGKALAGYTPHDLRATCICDDRIQGFTELEIAGRRAISTAMVRKYSKFIDQKKAAEASEKRARGA